MIRKQADMKGMSASVNRMEGIFWVEVIGETGKINRIRGGII